MYTGRPPVLQGIVLGDDVECGAIPTAESFATQCLLGSLSLGLCTGRQMRELLRQPVVTGGDCGLVSQDSLGCGRESGQRCLMQWSSVLKSLIV